MRKYLAIILCLFLAVSLAACGGEAPAEETTTAPTVEPETTLPARR